MGGGLWHRSRPLETKDRRNMSQHDQSRTIQVYGYIRLRQISRRKAISSFILSNTKYILIIKMYNYIVSFLQKKCSHQFSTEYKRGYKNAWINNIKHYKP